MYFTGKQRRPRLDQLVAGAEDPDPRAAADAELAGARRHGGPELGGAESRAGAQHGATGPQHLARRADVLAAFDRRAERDGAVALGRVLLADHGGGAVGDRGAGGDADRLARFEPCLRGDAGA